MGNDGPFNYDFLKCVIYIRGLKLMWRSFALRSLILPLRLIRFQAYDVTEVIVAEVVVNNNSELAKCASSHDDDTWFGGNIIITSRKEQGQPASESTWSHYNVSLFCSWRLISAGMHESLSASNSAANRVLQTLRNDPTTCPQVARRGAGNSRDPIGITWLWVFCLYLRNGCVSGQYYKNWNMMLM